MCSQIAGHLQDLCWYTSDCGARGVSQLNLGNRTFKSGTTSAPAVAASAAHPSSAGAQFIRSTVKLGVPNLTLESAIIKLPAGSDLVLHGQGFTLQDVCVEGQGARVIVGSGVTCSCVTVRGCEVSVVGVAVTLEHVVVHGSAGDGLCGFNICTRTVTDLVSTSHAAGALVRLVGCEAIGCKVGLAVSGRGNVCVEDSRFLKSLESGVSVAKVSSLEVGSVTLASVTVSESRRSGIFVETMCKAECTDCTFSDNGHYGVQTFPQAEARLVRCTFAGNRRGSCSGKGITEG